MSDAKALQQELLDLDAQRAALLTLIAPIQKQSAELQRELSKIERDTNDVRHKLSLARAQPHVSDHAVIRYLERKYGFSFEDVRAEILTPKIIEAINAGANAFKVNDAKFIVREKTVVTCHG